VTGALAVSGWLVALGAAALVAAVWHELARRMQVVARASHELRRPLAAARLGLYSLQRGEGQVPRRACALEAELGRASLALDDFEAVRSGRQPAFRVQEVDASALLVELADVWEPAVHAAGRELAVEPPPPGTPVTGEAGRLGQACGNLLANALEHGGGTITLRARVERGALRIEVADEGPGMPASPRCARPGGRGHGLGIVADVASSHGGRLAVLPARRGARVALELPVRGTFEVAGPRA